MATATYSEQIKILIELQKIDSVVHDFQKELSEHPAIQKKVEGDFEKKKSGFKAAEEAHKAEQLKQKAKEGELMSAEEKIKKLQGQLFQLKTNKEYSAMELEIKGLKADKSLLEEDILKLLDSVDAAKAKVVSEKELLAAEEKKSKESLDALKKKSQELTAEIAALDEKRKAYTANVDPKILSMYEKLLKSREGLALVPLKQNSCSGCHLELPPQQVHEVRLQDKPVNCESCARILYWLP